MLQAFGHQLVNQPPSGIFRIGRHPRNAAHLNDFAFHIDFHRIDHDLRGKMFVMKPPQHVTLRQHGQLFALDLLFRPAGFHHFRRRNLERISQQGVKLFQILFIQSSHVECIVQLHLRISLSESVVYP